MRDILVNSQYVCEGKIYNKNSETAVNKIAKIELLYTDELLAYNLDLTAPYDLMLLELNLCTYIHEFSPFNDIINGLVQDFERTMKHRLQHRPWHMLPKRVYFYRSDVNYSVHVHGSGILEVN